MKKPLAIAGATGTVLALAVLVFAYEYWSAPRHDPTADLLGQLPAGSSEVIFVDLATLRQSPFLAELYKWAPAPTTDPDYKRFLQATGFNYETDLNRVGIAILHSGRDSCLFAVADARLDHKKISAYALETGTRESRNGREIFSVPLSGSAGRVAFAFLSDNRIALTNSADLDAFSTKSGIESEAQAWRERFRRLAGAPIFAVIRQDAGAGMLPSQTPGGLASPQLSAVLNQLQWITVAGKPESDHLRVVLEGEGSPQTNTRQLSGAINTALLLAQAGLNDPKVRQQLQPQVRDAYLQVLKSADVSEIDRGETKSVRLMFDVTPDFLEAARNAMPDGRVAPGPKPFHNKSTIRN